MGKLECPQQEPVAIVRRLENAFIDGKRAAAFLLDESLPEGTKLYAAVAAQAEVVPATAELLSLWQRVDGYLNKIKEAEQRYKPESAPPTETK